MAPSFEELSKTERALSRFHPAAVSVPEPDIIIHDFLLPVIREFRLLNPRSSGCYPGNGGGLRTILRAKLSHSDRPVGNPHRTANHAQESVMNTAELYYVDKYFVIYLKFIENDEIVKAKVNSNLHCFQ